ncbi:hypothetical protein [Haladaptatus sp. ZSTT2]|uniref:hypothetical protein n=1 Tax=Haladaptatus sp. ZSTT2 TaxID=3120515 RepID=UPI00300EA3C9
MAMTTSVPKLLFEPTIVPISGNKEVHIDPGMPWPSTYRGSQYSIVTTGANKGHLLQWSHCNEIQFSTSPPEGLVQSLRTLGKSNGAGTGRIRITAAGEILTKIHADQYIHAHHAQFANGYISVYVGKLKGTIDFAEVSTNHISIHEGEIGIWDRLPFKHGETWTVSPEGSLSWKWGRFPNKFVFESAFEHTELIEKCLEYRPSGGRIYLTENGHVWCNFSATNATPQKQAEVGRLLGDWDRSASPLQQRLVLRRLTHTASQAEPDGLLPIYIGHLSDFDDGLVPKPVVDDPTYYYSSSRSESGW